MNTLPRHTAPCRGLGTQHASRPASSDRERGSGSESPSGSARHMQTSTGGWGPQGCDPRPAVCSVRTPRSGPPSICQWVSVSRDHLMTCGSHRTLRSRCPRRGSPGLPALPPGYLRDCPQAAASGRRQSGRRRGGVWPRGLQDAPRSLWKTGAQPHTITDSVSPAARGAKRSKTTDRSGSKTLRRPRHLCDWGTLLV